MCLKNYSVFVTAIRNKRWVTGRKEQENQKLKRWDVWRTLRIQMCFSNLSKMVPHSHMHLFIYKYLSLYIYIYAYKSIVNMRAKEKLGCGKKRCEFKFQHTFWFLKVDIKIHRTATGIFQVCNQACFSVIFFHYVWF